MNVYLAGGAVRDLLLGKRIVDRDYLVTNTTRDAFSERFPNAQEVGKAFPVFLVDRQEFAFPRATDLQEELRSRDLTVNAMLLDESGSLICHPHALEDINSRSLRPASPRSLHVDPLRVFRAARFFSTLPDFTPHGELLEAMRNVGRLGLLETISPDRVGVETLKAMAGARPGNFLRLLAETECLTPWFVEYEHGIEIPAGPKQYHDTHVLEHTCRIMDRLTGNPMAAWMGMCHDVGKLRTKTDQLPKHHGHDIRGMSMAETLGTRLRLSNKHITSGVMAAKWHMIAGRYKELRPGTRVDMLMELHLSETLENMFLLVLADQGEDFLGPAKLDLNTILAVTLPPESRNLGSRSGQILRELRSSALSKTFRRG